MGILRLIRMLKLEKEVIMINKDHLYSQDRLEGSLAAVRLGLLHTD